MRKSSIYFSLLAGLLFSLVFPVKIFAADPYGYLDVASCTAFQGWACDSDNFGSPIYVHFYQDPPQSSTYIGSTYANLYRSDLPGACGGNGYHGFSFLTPDSLKDGNNHTIHAFAINIPSGGNPPLTGTGKVINCPPPKPTCSGVSPSVNATTDSSGTLRVSATGVTNATDVRFGVWTEAGGQDDIKWYTKNEIQPGRRSYDASGGTWYADVKLAEHTGIGKIFVHVYMYNSANNDIKCGETEFKRIGGNHEGPTSSANCSATWGWTCDPSDFTASSRVHIYRDGKAGAGGVLLGETAADQSGEAAIGSLCGGVSNHRFSFPISYSQYPELYDNNTHPLYAYAINLNVGTNPLLPSTPKTFGPCSVPSPTPSATPTPSPSPSPSPNTQVLNLQVNSNADDATEEQGTGNVYAGVGSILEFGALSGVARNAGFRFNGVTGLAGATIVSAELSLYAQTSDGGSFTGTWYGHNTASAPAFTDCRNGCRNINNRPRTTAKVNGNDTSFGAWSAGYWYTLTGFGGIIQELVNKYGNPPSIALMHIYSSGGGTRVTPRYISQPTKAAKLQITYIPASSPSPTPSASPTTSPSPSPSPVPVACPVQTTNPRVQKGLISTRSISTNFGNSQGVCVIDPKAPLSTLEIPNYTALKSGYYMEVKSSSVINKVTPFEDNPPYGNFNSELTKAGDGLFLVNGSLTINDSNFPTTQAGKTAVIFVDGNLNISEDINYGANNTGLVFVVQGNVNIAESVTNINAVIISSGTIYTAGAGCAKSSVNVGAAANALSVNGSLISLDTGRIIFCRKLNDNSAPAEVINQQPKYLVILRNLYANTVPIWSEIP